MGKNWKQTARRESKSQGTRATRSNTQPDKEPSKPDKPPAKDTKDKPSKPPAKDPKDKPSKPPAKDPKDKPSKPPAKDPKDKPSKPPAKNPPKPPQKPPQDPPLFPIEDHSETIKDIKRYWKVDKIQFQFFESVTSNQTKSLVDSLPPHFFNPPEELEEPFEIRKKGAFRAGSSSNSSAQKLCLHAADNSKAEGLLNYLHERKLDVPWVSTNKATFLHACLFI